MRYFTSGFARAKSRKTCEKSVLMISMRKALGAESNQSAVLDGESEHGVKPGSVAFPACNCGPEPDRNFNNCCLTRTPFPLAVSFPGHTKALVAAANDTTPALAVKRPNLILLAATRTWRPFPAVLTLHLPPIKGLPNVATLLSP